MDGKTHKQTGLIVGIGAGIVNLIVEYEKKGYIDKKDLLNSLTILGSSYIGSMLPDIIEPAKHPNHRGFAHSYSSGASILAMYYKLFNKEEKNTLDYAIIGLGTGYLSHLVLDSTTPKGLPIV